MATYTFSLSSLNELSLLYSDKGIAIVPVIETGKIGDTFEFGVLYDFNPPAGSTPTYTIEWIDHNWNVIGNTQTLQYAPLESGWQSIQVTVTAEDTATGYYDVLTESYQFYVTPLNEYAVEFSLSFLSENPQFSFDNLDISKTYTYFPKWSSAYKNYFSNASKFISPLSESLTAKFRNLELVYVNNLPNERSFETVTAITKRLAVTKPRLINTDFGLIANLGPVGQYSFDRIPIGSLSVVDNVQPDIFTNTVNTGIVQIRLSRPQRLFVRVNKFVENGSVIIRGVDDRGELISEYNDIRPFAWVRTQNKFAIITEIESNVVSQVDLSTVINSGSYEDYSYPRKHITNREGYYYFPLIEHNGAYITIYDGTHPATIEQLRFNLGRLFDKVIITHHFDILALSGTTLYAGKLSLDFNNLRQPNSSTNNNDFIYVDNETPNIGDTVRLSINNHLFRIDSQSRNIRISIENQGNTQYLDKTGSLVSDKNTWIPVEAISDTLTLEINILNDDPYVFSLEGDGIIDPYYAMCYQNKCDTWKIQEGVTDFYIAGDNLVIVTPSGHQSVNAIRHGFLVDDKYIYIPFETNKIELLYD